MPSTYGTILITANHGRIRVTKNETITCGGINSIKIKFNFITTDWNELTKTVVFLDKHDTKITVALDGNGECFIPSSIIEECGEFMVGIYGENGTKRLPTNYLKFEINQGSYIL